jgi:hypothetical protein
MIAVSQFQIMISSAERSSLRTSPSCIPRVWPRSGQTLARKTGEDEEMAS